MNKRISLVEGIRRDQEAIDPVVEQNFLKYGTVKPRHPERTGGGATAGDDERTNRESRRSRCAEHARRRSRRSG